jgi:hypothetical protein
MKTPYFCETENVNMRGLFLELSSYVCFSALFKLDLIGDGSALLNGSSGFGFAVGVSRGGGGCVGGGGAV